MPEEKLEDPTEAAERLAGVRSWAEELVDSLVSSVEVAHTKALAQQPDITNEEFRSTAFKVVARACVTNADSKLHASVVNAAAVLALWELRFPHGDTPPPDGPPHGVDSAQTVSELIDAIEKRGVGEQ